ncbi:DoxX-like family protein [Streptomyces sp. NBC_00056]|uniref:DoxX-like family protein n=1 Tax=unclassified Streptomyces TaxID=2593676 RepID=UPI002E80C00A|nr:DoxX-like family protein [Streptomyces sp. NBC_00569]WUB90997.1 DoxX-like family protein [Streptomyces sp. NBC_00569]
MSLPAKLQGRHVVREQTGLGGAARGAVALVWFYEGWWCKVWPGRADQRAIVGDVPFLPAWAVTTALVAIGLAEVALGLWVLSGRRAQAAALVQTVLVGGFNAGGLLFSPGQIDEPGRLLTQNLAFVALVWMVAESSAKAAAR